ncbi:MAG: metallopeptidase TldD-related protein [Jatrophihabitans sp.]
MDVLSRSLPAANHVQRIVDVSETLYIRLEGAGRLVSAPVAQATVTTASWDRDGLFDSTLEPADPFDSVHGRSMPRVDTERVLASLHDRTGHGHVDMKLTAGVRRYDSDSGVTFERRANWFRAIGRRREGESTPTLVDGCRSYAALGDVVKRIDDHLNSAVHLVPARAVEEVPPYPVLLSPTVSAVVLHEGIGHPAEYPGRGVVGQRVGPVELHATACPPHAGLDDEGVPSSRVPLVRNGVVMGCVVDRSHADGDRAPSGLSQAALHSGPPMSRVTHLQVAAGTSDLTVSSMSEVVHVTGVTGAELVGDVILVVASEASVIRGGEVAFQLKPFAFYISLFRLGSHITAVGAVSARARAGACVKHGQELPSEAHGPAILLEGLNLQHA